MLRGIEKSEIVQKISLRGLKTLKKLNFIQKGPNKTSRTKIRF